MDSASAAALVFAGKSVATSTISFLVNKAFTHLSEYLKADGVDEIKQRIMLSLPKIQAVFDVVNPEGIKEESRALDACLWQLRDAVEEAEDALDEVEYYELEKKAKDKKVSRDWGSTLDKFMHNTFKFLMATTIPSPYNLLFLDPPVPLTIVGEADKGLTRHGTLKRLRKALEGLDKAAAGVADFFALAKRLNRCTIQQKEEFLKERETGSMLAAPQVFGRNKEKELLIGWLTTNSSCEDTEIKVSCSSNPLSLVSIVGHGGMGKTTLAQLICQHDAVKKHFEMVIWACVSTSFDATTVTRKILDSATWATPNANTLDALQKILEEKLKSVKFLLILDDVWDDKKTDQWERLFAPLRTGKSGSKILLTTRMQSVAELAANALASKSEYLLLRGLEEDENCMFFNHHAFPSSSSQDYPTLQPIGEQIAKNLRGYPLVTKVVASHLGDHLSLQYWDNFLNHRLEHFCGTAEDIMNVLKLSYYHLPTEMQTCFRYCSIFPQDFVFDKAQLVKMWVSSGLISQSESPMIIGEQYLDQLTRKSFFDVSSGKEKYVMHDLMHDLATYVSLGECARILDIASLKNVAITVRHMCIEHTDNLREENIKEITHLEHLRTIIIKKVDRKYPHKQENKVTLGLFLRDQELNIVQELVERSKSLRLFQTDLYHTYQFEGKLAMLKHLRFLEIWRIPSWSICGLLKLYHLKTLECENLEIESTQLRDVANIESQVNLMELCISNLIGTFLSQLWTEKLFFQTLEHLKLSFFGSCEQLLSLEKLLTIETLCLEDLRGLKRIGRELDVSGFECTKLFWPPNLRHLLVKGCPKLKELPLLPPSLSSLDLIDVGLTKLPRIGTLPKFKELPLLPPSLSSLHLRGVLLFNYPPWIGLSPSSYFPIGIGVDLCQGLTSLEGSLLEQKQHMGSLRVLRIHNCVQLESAPLPFDEMNRISEIDISKCPKLRTLGSSENKLPPSSISGESKGSQKVISWGGQFSKVRIVECDNLSSLGGLGSLPFIDSLEIKGCCKLAEAGLSLSANQDVSGGGKEHLGETRSSSQIGKLEIDLPSLLFVEPLNSLCQTKHLVIRDGSQMKSIPDGWMLQNRSSLKSVEVSKAKSLESLSSKMGDLSSLEKLRLPLAGKLRSLPDLPSSLKELYISRCHWELKKKLEEFGSPERNKICHVQRVEIGDSYFIMGKQCNIETFEQLRGKDNDTISSWANQQEGN